MLSNICHLHISYSLGSNESTECEVLFSRISPGSHLLGSSIQMTMTIRKYLTHPLIYPKKLDILPKGRIVVFRGA